MTAAFFLESTKSARSMTAYSGVDRPVLNEQGFLTVKRLDKSLEIEEVFNK